MFKYKCAYSIQYPVFGISVSLANDERKYPIMEADELCFHETIGDFSVAAIVDFTGNQEKFIPNNDE